MTGKDIYKAMQDIDRNFVVEAWDVKPTVKKCWFVVSERMKDNLATVAIICLVVAAVLVVPRVTKDFGGEGLNPAGIETTAYEETSRQEETVTTPEVYYDNVPKDAKVVDGILYEYSTWLERYVISKWSVPDGSGIVSETSGFGMTPKLSDAVSHNAVITESNADKMYYLVEIYPKNQSDNSLQANKTKELYKVLDELGNYGIYFGEAGNYKSDYGDFYLVHDEFVYGIMTYDEMKELSNKFAEKNPGNCLYYDLLSVFEIDRANIYTDDGVAKYTAEELSAEWKYVYSLQYDKYIMSKNRMQNGTYYSDSYSIPTKDERITYSNKLTKAIGDNKINADNAKSVAYLVEINVYDVVAASGNSEDNKISSTFSNEITGDKLKQEYERLKKLCDFDIRMGEKYWDTGNNTPVIYGMLTCEQMKKLPLNDGYGYAFQITGEKTFGASGIIEESLYGKDYMVIDNSGKSQ